MIKTLDELRRVRRENFSKVALRVHSQLPEEKIEVRVGVSDSNNPLGQETLNAFMDDVAAEGLNNVRVILVENHGDNQAEPIVGITILGQESIIYENVTSAKAHEIFQKHIKGGYLH